MVTRALHDSGLHLVGTGAEDLIDAADDNPEGFWENKAIVACNEELLEATGGAWDNPPELPPLAHDDPRIGHVIESSTVALAALGEHEHWGFKDPRTCLTAAYWLDLCPDLHFVICVRHPLEVALSLKRRNQNSYSLGLRLWEQYYTSVLEQVPRERRIVTHYESYFNDSDREVARVCAFVGLTPAPPRVLRELRHHEIAVGLDDAGASATLRALYTELCREAAVPLPSERATDEGRVRRLVLDGAVAARHAEQRQDAIDRLQEREKELRARIAELERERAAAARERAAAEADARARVHAAEQKVLAEHQRVDALHARTLETMRALQTTVGRTHAKVEELDTRVRAYLPGRFYRSAARAWRGVKRFGLRPTRRALVDVRAASEPVARDAFHQLPPPTQLQLRRGRNLLVRLRHDPRGTAITVRRKLRPKARAAAQRLPPPAEHTLRRGYSLYRRGRAEPVRTAKVVAQRLPAPAQDVLRRGYRAAANTRAASASHVQAVRDLPKAPPAPKGPDARGWKAGYDAMVRDALPQGAAWLVVQPGSPASVRDTREPRGTPFPATRNGAPLADDLAHIAQLEALRYAGQRFLVCPEGARPWFRRQAELRDHVVRNYRVLADEAGAGTVFDLCAPPTDGPRSLRGEVNRLVAGRSASPAVLDWTDLDVGAELPGLVTFRPPPGEGLPYADHSVDVVVVDDAHDHTDARRVATLGVIVVAEGGSGAQVRAVESDGDEALEAADVLVISSDPTNDAKWRLALAERVAAAGAELQIAEVDAGTLAAARGHDVIVVVEPYVLPLPGSIELAAAQALADPNAVIAAKVMRADGRLEAAGGTVFFDRSVACIAAGSPDVRAPWHEYVRPVCWAPGMLAASAALVDAVSAQAASTGRSFVREWCARVWAAGYEVAYHPEITTVRVQGDGSESAMPLRESSWQRVLDLRPQRPSELTDGAWRYLLAHEEVEACRG
jgi:hypothetical protein